MSSQICRAASRSARTLFPASRNSVLFSKRRAVAEASATSFRGRMSRLASVCRQKEARNTLRGWLSGALVLPAAVYMLQDQPAQAAEMERTFILIKPDGMQRGLIGKTIAHFEGRGFKLVAIKLVLATDVRKDICKKYYVQYYRRGPGQANALCESLCSDPVLAMVWEGKGVINHSKQLIGQKGPMGDLAVSDEMNIIEGSNNSGTANDWIEIWFKEQEFVKYKKQP